MEKLEFEQEINKILIKAGYLKEGQVARKINIHLDVEDNPEIDISFLVAS